MAESSAKVRLELVVLKGGKYTSVRPPGRREVREAVPRKLFDRANLLGRTQYRRSVKVRSSDLSFFF